MLGWLFRGKDAVSRAPKETDEESYAKRLKVANFTEEDGVPCLFQKVCSELEMNYIKWKHKFAVNSSGDIIYTNEESKIEVSYCYEYGDMSYYFNNLHTFRGSLKIGDVRFILNHDSCRKFKELWESVEEKITQEKKDSVLKQWGCK